MRGEFARGELRRDRTGPSRREEVGVLAQEVLEQSLNDCQGNGMKIKCPVAIFVISRFCVSVYQCSSPDSTNATNGKEKAEGAPGWLSPRSMPLLTSGS